MAALSKSCKYADGTDDAGDIRHRFSSCYVNLEHELLHKKAGNPAPDPHRSMFFVYTNQ